MRRTRLEYLTSLFPTKLLTWQKPTKAKKAKRVRMKPKKWMYALPNGLGGIVYAFTRSEARSEIKKQCDLRDRVPIGTQIMEAAR